MIIDNDFLLYLFFLLWIRNEKKGVQRPNSKDPIPEPVEVQ